MFSQTVGEIYAKISPQQPQQVAIRKPLQLLHFSCQWILHCLVRHQYQDIISDYSSVRYVARNDIANVTHPWTKRYTLKIFSVIWGKNKLLIQITSNWQKDHCVKNRTEQTLTIRLFTKHVFTLDLFRKTYTINKRNLYDWATNSFHCPTTISGLLCSKCYASSPRRHISPFWLHNIRL